MEAKSKVTRRFSTDATIVALLSVNLLVLVYLTWVSTEFPGQVARLSKIQDAINDLEEKRWQRLKKEIPKRIKIDNRGIVIVK